MTSAPPGLLQHLDDVLSVIRRPRMGLVLDFDGTISEIASTPDEATLFPRLRGGARKPLPQA